MTDLDRAARFALLDPLTIVARIACCAPPPAATFIDPLTRERIAYASAECDAHGAALVGVDEGGAWIGTERAALALDDGAERYFALHGYLGADAWCAYVAARDEDTALDYADRLGARDVGVEALAVDEIDLL